MLNIVRSRHVEDEDKAVIGRVLGKLVRDGFSDISVEVLGRLSSPFNMLLEL